MAIIFSHLTPPSFYFISKEVFYWIFVSFVLVLSLHLFVISIWYFAWGKLVWIWGMQGVNHTPYHETNAFRQGVPFHPVPVIRQISWGNTWWGDTQANSRPTCQKSTPSWRRMTPKCQSKGRQGEKDTCISTTPRCVPNGCPIMKVLSQKVSHTVPSHMPHEFLK